MLRRKEKQKKVIKKYHFHTKLEHVQNKEIETFKFHEQQIRSDNEENKSNRLNELRIGNNKNGMEKVSRSIRASV